MSLIFRFIEVNIVRRAALFARLSPFLLAFVSTATLAQSDPYGMALEPRPGFEVAPKIGEIETVTPGDRVVWTEAFRVVEGAQLSEDVAFPTAAEPNLIISSSSKLYRIQSSRPFKACTIELHANDVMPCLIDYHGTGRFDRIAKDFFDSATPLPHKITYSRIPAVRLPVVATGFSRELRYQGATADGLKFSYREFSNEMARPAFTEDLSIPTSKSFPQQVAVKGLILTIFEIGPLGMKYRLDSLKPDSGWQTSP